MATEATVTSWSDLTQDHPMAKIARRRIVGQKMMVSQVRLSQGFDLASHQHENEQFVVVLAGRCLFGLGTPGTAEHRTVEVMGGQALVLPPNVPHSCLALEETDILDLFSPVSATTGVDQPGAHG